MSKQRIRIDRIAQIIKQEVSGLKIRKKNADSEPPCGHYKKRNRQALGPLNLRNLIPSSEEAYENSLDIYHQIATTGLETAGFLSPLDKSEEELLSVSGMHLTNNPGFGYNK